MRSVLPVVSLKGVKKAYRSFTLTVSSLDIFEGEFVSLIGESGAGKSTLLNIIGGFVEPDTGSVMIDGKSVRRQRGHSRIVRTVFQDLALFPNLNVDQQLTLAARRRFPKLAARELANQWVTRLDLEEHRNKPPRHLSGGQRQRLAVGRALIAAPRVLLLDEPMTALDHDLRGRLWAQIDSLGLQHSGPTFIVITHDPDLALSRSDRLVVIHGGDCVQVDSPERVYSQPASSSVARLLGPANIISLNGHEAVIRPEKIGVSITPDLGYEFTHPARLVRKSYLGSTTELTLLWNDRPVLARQPEDLHSLSVDSQVFIGWNSHDLKFLN